MPRPPVKRRKPSKQKSRSPSRSRRAPPEAGLTSTPRVKLQQQLANKLVGQRPQDSDDSDRLVTRTRHGRSARRVEQIFASGGVAKGDRPGVFPTKEERRTRLRSETEEILRRSRSKSIEAAKERLSKSRSNSAGGDDTRKQPTSSPALVPNTQSQNQDSILPRAHPTPGAETSVLGTLKPRRRQASILHMVDNNDSSIINPEDEEQFLPDDESTPLNAHKVGGRTSNARVSTGSLASASRKRKFGANEPARTTTETVLVASTPQLETSTTTPGPEDSMSNPKSPKQRPARVYDDDDEIMAPPQSSSPESSPQKPKSPPPAKSKKAPPVPTTEQLQSMMPSKRRKGTRQRNQVTEFDIPEDSTSDANEGAEDESAFLPTKRTTKSRNRKDSSKPTTNGKTTGRTGKAKATTPAGAATPAGKRSKPTSKSTSTPLKVTTPRTPLPLTRNPNQENKTLSLARNQNSKPSGGANATRTNPATSKPSGGSRPQRHGPTSADSDKENTAIPGRRSARLSAKRTSPDPDTDAVQPSIETDVDEMDVEPDLVRGDTGESVQVVNETPVDEMERSADVRAWKSKWGDIDTWEMEFEDVDVSTGNSSPLRVSVV